MDPVQAIKRYNAWLVIKKDQLVDGIMTDRPGTAAIGWAPYDFQYSLRIIYEMLLIQKEYFEKFSIDISQADSADTAKIVNELSEAIRLYTEMDDLWKNNKTDAAEEKAKEFFKYYGDHFFNWWD